MEMPPPPVQPSRINLGDYQQPFGYAPPTANLREIFLALPTPLAGDMPVDIRQMFIDYATTAGAVNHMFDEKARYITYFNDNPYTKIQASCRFTIKVLPSTRYRYVVTIHLDRDSQPPSASNTFFLVPSGSQWIDITDQVLPLQTPRDWYFQPAIFHDTFQTGPYQLSADKYWRAGERKYDLTWSHDRLRIRKAASTRFSFP